MDIEKDMLSKYLRILIGYSMIISVSQSMLFCYGGNAPFILVQDIEYPSPYSPYTSQHPTLLPNNSKPILYSYIGMIISFLVLFLFSLMWISGLERYPTFPSSRFAAHEVKSG